MDVLSLNFKRELGQRRGVYLLSTAQYANFGIYKVGMASEQSFNERFSQFKYAGYGAVDRILCFGLICVWHGDSNVKVNTSRADRDVARVCRSIEQDMLRRLRRFRLSYPDTGRLSEWVRVDIAWALGVLREYSDGVYTSQSAPALYVATRCYDVKVAETNSKRQQQERRTAKTQWGDSK